MPYLTGAILLATVLHVSPGGGDAGDGSAARPFRSLTRARDAARAAAKPATVELAAGDYRLTAPLEFTAADNGVTWRAARTGEARLLGGVRLSPSAAKAHSGKILAWDLRAAGMTNFGRFVSRGFGRPTAPAHAELFFQDRRMTVARWPDSGFARIAAPGDPDPPDDEHGKRHGRLEHGFSFAGDKPAVWKSFANVWVHGYWSWDWANSYEAISAFDRDRGAVKTAAPYGLYGFRTGQRFYVLNAIEELTAPGEYFVDASAGKLYFWPPAPLASGELLVSELETPLIRVSGASDVTIEGLTLEATRATAVEVAGGARVRLLRATIRNVGNHAVVVTGGTSHAVTGCHIYRTGDAGIRLSGGDRATLTPGRHSATGNHIHEIGEWSRTYNPAVQLEGVGHVVAHNHIHHGPHSAVILTGNDHLIEYNEIHHMAAETGDVGAFYMGRDYTERGVVVRHNYFHHNGGYGMGSMAVYLDDCASGATVYGNIFHKTSRAVFMGGGRDHTVENNIFVDCEPAVHLDARGLDPRPVWQNMVYKTMKERLAAVRYLDPPYILRYPLLGGIRPYIESTGGVPPEGNRVFRNICVRGKWLNIVERARPVKVEIEGNLVDTDPLFVDEANGDFRLRPESPAWKLGFQAIPVDRIGPGRE